MNTRQIVEDFVARVRLGGAASDPESASFELTEATRTFSKRTRSALDDNLSLCATLTRAGEVRAAQRLVAELEREVKAEAAVLAKRVEELRAAHEAS